MEHAGTDMSSVHPGIVETFRTLYRREPRLFYAPGRINLIGEHTDYNDGFVMPFAIDRGVTVAACPGMKDRIDVYSLDFQESLSLDLNAPRSTSIGTWRVYVEGVARCLISRGVKIQGTNLIVSSNLAMGAGLASSAGTRSRSYERTLSDLQSESAPMEIVLTAQQAEHEFAGTESGIMDPYISLLGRRDSCLLLDCRSLQSTPLPLPFGYALVVCDTNVKHKLASSSTTSAKRNVVRA
jgi:galactokinase